MRFISLSATAFACLISTTSHAAENFTQEQLKWMERKFNYLEQPLAAYLVCSDEDGYRKYLETTKDLISLYPGTDPIKLKAAFRSKEREAENVADLSLHDRSNQFFTEEDLELQIYNCTREVKWANEEIAEMDRLILKR